MRIAIPLDENKQDVCVVLARTPYFLFHVDSFGSDHIEGQSGFVISIIDRIEFG
ncbi:MAG: hypothetical protein LUE65_11745 [Clostridiales bacterium]|nr:hypothetical protein [Clostridiales bacterium]